MLKPGDIVFISGNSLVSKLVKQLTFGKVSHVGIMYDASTIFETDGRWGKAEFHPIDKYNGNKVEIYRYIDLTNNQMKLVQAMCKEYEGTPYSYWDIVVKGSLFWLHPGLRNKISAFLGNKRFMICNELVMTILYRVTGFKLFKYSEGSNPSDLRQDIRCSNRFSRIV